MAIAFTYTEATNIVVVTGGTSGTPATFADFVTADRAGTAELLAESTGESAMTLTYPVRPVEAKAIKVNIVVTDKVEDGYVHVHGTDFAGNAQNESIATNSSDTYETVLYYATITSIDCTVESDGGGDDWAEGSIQVTQPQWGVIWDYGEGQYLVACWLDIGGSGTSTYFSTKKEQISFTESTAGDQGHHFEVQAAATFNIGEKQGDWGTNGSFIKFYGGNRYGGRYLIVGGTLNIYGSILFRDSAATKREALFNAGTVDIKNSILMGDRNDGGGAWNCRFEFKSGLSSLTLQDVFVTNLDSLYLDYAPDTMSNVQSHYCYYGMQSQQSGVEASDSRVTTYGNKDYFTWTSGAAVDLTLIDPKANVIAPYQLGHADSFIKESYTCNVTVADKDGTLLDGVVVDCEDVNTDAVWAAGTILTGAVDTGKIVQQTIQYKTWTGTSSTLADFSPHKFTISKAGYETLVLENITVDAPIAWHLELGGKQQITVGGNDYFSDDS